LFCQKPRARTAGRVTLSIEKLTVTEFLQLSVTGGHDDMAQCVAKSQMGTVSIVKIDTLGCNTGLACGINS
jgi:hypothetical protein